MLICSQLSLAYLTLTITSPITEGVSISLSMLLGLVMLMRLLGQCNANEPFTQAALTTSALLVINLLLA